MTISEPLTDLLDAYERAAQEYGRQMADGGTSNVAWDALCEAKEAVYAAIAELERQKDAAAAGASLARRRKAVRHARA